MTVLDPLRDPTEAFGKLDEQKYKAELDLVDRYQLFVAELLRLSLAGIAVFGFLYQHIFSRLDIMPCASEVVAQIICAKRLAAFGVIGFGFCTVFAHFFRFFATEGARFYIEALRFTPPSIGSCETESWYASPENRCLSVVQRTGRYFSWCVRSLDSNILLLAAEVCVMVWRIAPHSYIGSTPKTVRRFLWWQVRRGITIRWAVPAKPPALWLRTEPTRWSTVYHSFPTSAYSAVGHLLRCGASYGPAIRVRRRLARPSPSVGSKIEQR